MSKIYGTGKVCPYQAGVEKPQCNLETEGLSLEPGNFKSLKTVEYWFVVLTNFGNAIW